MNKQNTLNLTREKHLDHLVKVIPFIFFCYGVQCFTLFKIGQTNITGTTLLFLGVALATLASFFALYDLKHSVVLGETCLTIKFLWYKKEISYNSIKNIDINDADDSFCKVKITALSSKHTFYFLDNGREAKEWIESRLASETHIHELPRVA